MNEAYEFLSSLKKVINEHGQSESLTSFLKADKTLSGIPGLFLDNGEVSLEKVEELMDKNKKDVPDDLKMMGGAMVPTKSMGKLKLGMTQDDVKSEMGIPTSSYKRENAKMTSYDEYTNGNVYYDHNMKVVAMEMYTDKRKKGTMMMGKDDLMMMDYDAMKEYMKGKDEDMKSSPDGMQSEKMGLDVCSPKGKMECMTMASASYIKSMKNR